MFKVNKKHHKIMEDKNYKKNPKAIKHMTVQYLLKNQQMNWSRMEILTEELLNWSLEMV